METQHAEAQQCLAKIEQAIQCLETRISAYESGVFDLKAKDSTIECAKDAIDDLFVDEHAELEAPLCQYEERFESALGRLNCIDANLDEVLQACNKNKLEAEAEFVKKRRSINGGNLAKGFWPLYGGFVVALMCAYLANGLGAGVTGSILGGVLGYLLGHQLALQLTKRYQGKATGTDQESLAELDRMRAAWEKLSDQRIDLIEQQKLVDQEINEAEDLQFTIHRAIEEIKNQ